MGATTTLLSFEKFEELPDQPGKRELLKGELIESPPAEFRHNEIAHRIYKRLDAALDAAHALGLASELGIAYHEMGYKLASDVYVQPDVSVTHAGQAVDKYLDRAPAIAIEVISPSNSAEQMDMKTDLYFECGALEVWQVYPRTRHIMVQVPGGSRFVRDHESLTTPLLPGFSLPISEILGE